MFFIDHPLHWEGRMTTQGCVSCVACFPWMCQTWSQRTWWRDLTGVCLGHGIRGRGGYDGVGLCHSVHLIKTQAKNSGKIKYSNPTRTTHPFLYQKGKICELTGNLLTDPGTHPDFKPKLKVNQELYEILGIAQHHFLRKAEIVRNLKPLIRTLTDGNNFTKMMKRRVFPVCSNL